MVRKPREREQARRLRAEQGLAIRKIAARLGVSPSSVLLWTAEIVLTEEQRRRNRADEQANRDSFRARAAAWSERCRGRRRAWQEEGRRRARQGDALHMAGCMLYWAEGAKSRNTVTFANSDPGMVRFFARFLTESLGVVPEDFRVRLNVYTNNGLSVEEIEGYWLQLLGAPRTCLRAHSLNHFPTSSSGRRHGRLRYGVCTLMVSRSTRLVQHIYGAIQEYGGFDEPRWLD
jgi:hypothetical protein